MGVKYRPSIIDSYPHYNERWAENWSSNFGVTGVTEGKSYK